MIDREIVYRHGAVRLAASAAALTLLAFAGHELIESAHFSATSEHISTDLPRCFSHPLPLAYTGLHGQAEPLPPTLTGDRTESASAFQVREGLYIAAHQRWLQGQLPTPEPPLTIAMQNDHLKGSPSPAAIETMRHKLAPSVVKVLAKLSPVEDIQGSGFLTNDQQGQQVVVTAAHVVNRSSLSNMTVQAANGQSMHPNGGCQIYESNGQFLYAVDNTKNVNYQDLAILTFPKSFTEPSLSVASTAVERGEYAYFINYQKNAKLQDPYVYAGLIATTASNWQGFSAITGISELPTAADQGGLSQISLQDGGSGGLVSRSGEIDGISVGLPSIIDPTQSALALKHNENITFLGVHYGNASGKFDPVAPTLLISGNVIQMALRSPELK